MEKGGGEVAARRRIEGELQWIADRRPRCYAPRDVVALSVVRNGAIHVDAFIEHHLNLGVRHVVLMDNCSTDDTVERAGAYGNVSVLRCCLPFATFKHDMRRFLVSRFGGHGWCFVLDIDERLHYPGQALMELGDFIAYLDANGYTAVVGYLLDLFPAGPVSEWPVEGKALEADSCWYDLSDLQKEPYEPRHGCRLSTTSIRKYRGGIRKATFGVGVDLTKTPILNGSRKVVPANSSHQCRHAVLADVTVLLAHYKFHGGFADESEEIRRRKSHAKGYDAYCAVLEHCPNLTLYGPAARRFRGVDELVLKDFLAISPEYVDWVADHDRRATPA